jgi:hypothetical protein
MVVVLCIGGSGSEARKVKRWAIRALVEAARKPATHE